MLEIRVLTPEDWPVWRELRLAALADAPAAFCSRLADWQGDGDRPERWRDRLALAGSYNLVAVLDGHPVGMVAGVPADEPGVAELISMWVSPAARGRGVSDALVAAVVDWAGQVGAQALALGVIDGNEHAVALYRRHGFLHSGQLDEPVPEGVRRQLRMSRPVR